MEDCKIIELYWQRCETAIEQTQKKYGRYCFSIANNILPNEEDAQECVNDTYLAAWNAIPPNRPKVLSTFLGKLTRRISIDRWRILSADKRGGGAIPLALEELNQCIPGNLDAQAQVEAKELAVCINSFLAGLPEIERRVFLLRYFDMASLKEIQEKFHFSDSKVKTTLYRTRKKLKTHLEKEGY